MTKYDENKICFYMFKCKSDNIYNCYVGHTTNFTKRKSNHKSACNNENHKLYNLKVYKTIRSNGGWKNWSLIEIRKQFCKDKREAERIEQVLIEKNNADMNTYSASRTPEQYYLDNKEQIAEKQKIYQLENKEQIIEYHKNYYLENKEQITQKFDCECGGKYIHSCKSRHLKSLKHLKYCESVASK